jgi:hypothetical protein
MFWHSSRSININSTQFQEDFDEKKNMLLSFLRIVVLHKEPISTKLYKEREREREERQTPQQLLHCILVVALLDGRSIASSQSPRKI